MRCLTAPLFALLLSASFVSLSSRSAHCQEGTSRPASPTSGRRFEGPFHIVAMPAQQVQVMVTETMTSPELSASQWGIVAAQAPSYEGQTVLESSLCIPGVRAARVQSLTDRSPLKQGYWLATYPVTREEQSHHATAQSIYRVLLYARVLTPGAGAAAASPLTGEQRFLYLTASNVTNYASLDFKRWLRQANLIRRAKERDLDFAYRAMEYIAWNFHYHWVQGSSTDPAEVANRGVSHCTGIANLYIATLRANGIPARLVVGRRIVKSSSQQAMVTNGTLTIDPGTAHVAAEFYAEGVGWVPAEPTGALGAKNVSPFFGRSNGSMLVMHFDSMWLDTRMRNLQGMEWDYGRWRGSWNGWHLSDSMQVQPTVFPGALPQGVEVLQRSADATHDFALLLQGTAKGTRTAENGALKIEVTATDGTFWHVLLEQNGVDLKEGEPYTLCFRARADAPRDLRVEAASDQTGDYRNLGLAQKVSLTTDWQTFRFTFNARNVVPNRSRIPLFPMAAQIGTVWIADISVKTGAQ